MADAPAREKTTYTVLKLRKPEVTSEGTASTPMLDKLEQWAVVARSIPATSADAAVRAHVEKQAADAAGMYLAVPARSWKPTTVKIEQTTVVKLGSA